MIFFMVGAPIAVHLLLVCWRLCLWLLKILVWHFQGGEIIRWRDYLLAWARFFSFLAQRNGLDRVDLSDQWKPRIGNRCWWAKQVRTANGNTYMHARCFFHGVPRSTRIWRQCRTTEDPAIFIKAKALFKWSAVIRKDLASSCSAEYTPAKISYTRRHPERTPICQGAAPILAPDIVSPFSRATWLCTLRPPWYDVCHWAASSENSKFMWGEAK